MEESQPESMDDLISSYVILDNAQEMVGGARMGSGHAAFGNDDSCGTGESESTAGSAATEMLVDGNGSINMAYDSPGQQTQATDGGGHNMAPTLRIMSRWRGRLSDGDSPIVSPACGRGSPSYADDSPAPLLELAEAEEEEGGVGGGGAIDSPYLPPSSSSSSSNSRSRSGSTSSGGRGAAPSRRRANSSLGFDEQQRRQQQRPSPYNLRGERGSRRRRPKSSLGFEDVDNSGVSPLYSRRRAGSATSLADRLELMGTANCFDGYSTTSSGNASPLGGRSRSSSRSSSCGSRRGSMRHAATAAMASASVAATAVVEAVTTDGIQHGDEAAAEAAAETDDAIPGTRRVSRREILQEHKRHPSRLILGQEENAAAAIAVAEAMVMPYPGAGGGSAGGAADGSECDAETPSTRTRTEKYGVLAEQAALPLCDMSTAPNSVFSPTTPPQRRSPFCSSSSSGDGSVNGNGHALSTLPREYDSALVFEAAPGEPAPMHCLASPPRLVSSRRREGSVGRDSGASGGGSGSGSGDTVHRPMAHPLAHALQPTARSWGENGANLAANHGNGCSSSSSSSTTTTGTSDVCAPSHTNINTAASSSAFSSTSTTSTTCHGPNASLAYSGFVPRTRSADSVLHAVQKPSLQQRPPPMTRTSSLPRPRFFTREESREAAAAKEEPIGRFPGQRPDGHDVRGDLMAKCALPVTGATHKYWGGIRLISPTTLADVLDGHYDSTFDRCIVIDCRYPYEYEGGHIRNAHNLWTMDQTTLQLLGNTSLVPLTEGSRTVIVFHCEFSAVRAPTQFKFVRQLDRFITRDIPELIFPEMYVLQGGYKAFFGAKSEYCTPPAYVPMDSRGLESEFTQCEVRLNCSREWARTGSARQSPLTLQLANAIRTNGIAGLSLVAAAIAGGGGSGGGAGGGGGAGPPPTPLPGHRFAGHVDVSPRTPARSALLHG